MEYANRDDLTPRKQIALYCEDNGWTFIENKNHSFTIFKNNKNKEQ